MMLPSQHPGFSANFWAGAAVRGVSAFLSGLFRSGATQSATRATTRGVVKSTAKNTVRQGLTKGSWSQRLVGGVRQEFKKSVNKIKYGERLRLGKNDLPSTVSGPLMQGGKRIDVAPGAKTGYVGSQGTAKRWLRGAQEASDTIFWKPYVTATNTLPGAALRKMGFEKSGKFWQTNKIARGVGGTAGMFGVPAIASRVATRNDGPKDPPTYHQNVQYSNINKRTLPMERFKQNFSYFKDLKTTKKKAQKIAEELDIIGAKFRTKHKKASIGAASALSALAGATAGSLISGRGALVGYAAGAGIGALAGLAQARADRRTLRYLREARSINRRFRDK